MVLNEYMQAVCDKKNCRTKVDAVKPNYLDAT